MIERLERLVELLERLNVALGGSGEVTVFEGQHFKVTEERGAAPKAIKAPNHKPGKKKLKRSRKTEKLPPPTKAKPNELWPFERGSSRSSSLSHKLQIAIKPHLQEKGQGSREELFELCRKALPPSDKAKKNKKGYGSWRDNLSALLSFCCKEGYLERFNQGKEIMYRLPN